MGFSSNVPTPHISAKIGDISKTVLMPGDPLRAKFVAEQYFDNPVCFNNVRGMFGYSGTYKEVPVSVMGSGMGMASMGIYSYELYANYGVESIIRIGTCGAAKNEININDVILATKAYSVSNFAFVQNGYTKNVIPATKQLNTKIIDMATKLNKKLILGAIRSGDVFYMEDIPREKLDYMNELTGFEMEAFALFCNAMVLKKQASCILTVTDKRSTNEALSSEDREKSLSEMFTLALESAISL